MKRFNLLVMAVAIAMISPAIAQENKKSTKLGLSYSRINDQAPELNVTIKSKQGKKFEPVQRVDIEFYFAERSSNNLIGKAISNRKGIASVELSPTVVAKLDSMDAFTFVAFVPESKTCVENSVEIAITKAKLELTFIDVENRREIGSKLLTFKDGKWIETQGVDVKLFVRRSLADLSLTEHALTTDDAGDVSAEFDFKPPIPGDANGNIIVGAKVEDNETYGTIMSMKYVKWGTSKKADTSFYERSLWGSRDKTPVWLLVVPNVAIVAVWGLIFYMFYLIYRIRKIGVEKFSRLF